MTRKGKTGSDEIDKEKDKELESHVKTDESSSLTDGTTEESEIEVNEKNAKIHTEIKRIEGMDFYYKKFLCIILALVLTLAVVFMRGSSSQPSIIGATKCSIKDWSVFAIYLVAIVLVSYLCSSVVQKEQILKESSGWRFSKFEKKFSDKFRLAGNLIGFVTGFISAITGMSGGTMLIPVMMSFDFLPSVISYTVSYLTFKNKLVITLVVFLT